MLFPLALALSRKEILGLGTFFLVLYCILSLGILEEGGGCCVEIV